MIITIGSQENTDIVAPTTTTIRNQSVDANPTSNPKKSDTASKQEKNPAYHPLPGIHFATYHKPSSKMIAGTDSNAEAGTSQSSGGIEHISFTDRIKKDKDREQEHYFFIHNTRIIKYL